MGKWFFSGALKPVQTLCQADGFAIFVATRLGRNIINLCECSRSSSKI